MEPGVDPVIEHTACEMQCTPSGSGSPDGSAGVLSCSPPSGDRSAEAQCMGQESGLHDVVAFECLHNCLGHAVALGAFDRLEARFEVQGRGNLDGAISGRSSLSVNHCTLRGVRMSPNRCSTRGTIMSRIIAPEIPAVVATSPPTL
jgi:hypothetical protein